VPIGWADLHRALELRDPSRLTEEMASRAGVALMLREAELGLELLFIHRAEHPGDPWSGQMGFPGGRAEAGDADLEETALRETEEEVGLPRSRAESLGRLDELRAVSRRGAMSLSISPYVFRASGPFELAPNHEVQGIYWLSLDELIGPRHRSTMDYPYDGQTLHFPCLRLRGRTIWGLTYRIFSNLQELLHETGAAEPPAPLAPDPRT
jgi:8-oxo-dGTP pyrophosphatase MutT (NUDIX family)